MKWLLVFMIGCSSTPDEDGAGVDSESDTADTTEVVRPGCDQPMPTAPVIPIYDRVTEELVNNRVTYSIPPSPKGVLFALHGTGGNITTVEGVEWWRLFNLLHCEGIGVVIGEATEKKWDLSSDPSNGDFVRMAELRDYVVSETELTADLPVFVMGFSNGGQFASVFSDLAQRSGWDVAAMTIHNSPGSFVPDVPTHFHTCENDDTVDAGNVQSAQEAHAATGQTSALFLFEEVAVDPLYFTVLESHDAEQSAFVFDDLVANGLIDADGNRLVEVAAIDRALDVWAKNTTANGPLRVTAQLHVAWATHRVSGAFAEDDRDLFVGELD